ncbi:PP2C family protein-serine/threonine phosphatase [Nonomuraea jabiensis]|uniref:Serine phosphatase RsbU (Regulator of sigma subunit) n=1 Tax=Nonomuraea jabiensis TaxID=882448 RepID=A0A7W9GG21_9ACTN|nr:PP2C family protein-serine/threonine phosphatase [Nonomuraea jabiensis]MBB5783167.1 serine phosphatase RsbU (regulator of sigma subunit) [Nonomuraea jabiensis]
MIVVITAADLLTPSSVHIGSLLVAAPAITAPFASPLLTTVIGTMTIAAEVLIGMHDQLLGTLNFQAGLLGLALVCLFLVLFALVRDRQQRELTQVRSVATAVQTALLRPVPERLGPLHLASAYMAAEAEAQIGGDIYAAVRTPHCTRLIIGDARGKGLPAISEAATLLGAFRETARRCPELPDLVADLEDSYLTHNHPDNAADQVFAESFVTAAIVDIPDERPVLTIVNCGHPPPLLLSKGRVISLDVSQPAPPLGLGGLSEPQYLPTEFAFGDGDLLLLYTDGVIEARDTTGTFFPLAKKAARWTEEEPAATLKGICDDLLAHVGGRLGDDAALIAIRRVGYPP